MMRALSRRWMLAAMLTAAAGACQQETNPATPGAATITAVDPLSAWVDGPNKRAITDFVQRVTRGPGAIPAAERIAVFDNDGTLWSEQPIYVEFQFAIDRGRELLRERPELASHPAFAIAGGDPAAIAALPAKDLVELLALTHAGTAETFPITVDNWLGSALHPRFHRPYISLVYEPQLQLMDYLRAAGFTVYIVSGGGVDFMRAFAEPTYGVPPQNVIGSSSRGRFEIEDGRSVVRKTSVIQSIDDGPGKAENIQLHIGRRPIIAVGNSDGDIEMLQYAADGPLPSLEILIHHDDGVREYAYDRASHVGKLDRGLDLAATRGWLVVSMKDDWRTVFRKRGAS